MKTSKKQTKKTPSRELSESQLEQVAGGAVDTFVRVADLDANANAQTTYLKYT